MGNRYRYVSKIMGEIRISFIATVFNESENIDAFLNSIFSQAKLPDEIVIVDGGSTDETVRKIEKKNLESKYKGNFLLLVKKGNRSIGRNEAIKRATGEIIVCSDAGCILEKSWLYEIIRPFKNKSIDVVAGYYSGLPTNLFQKCLVPYVLIMPDRVNAKAFLPSTRSMAFKKNVWSQIGGFPEQYDYSEDYFFARQLRANKKKMHFAKKARVYWIPRNNFIEAYLMFFRFARSDIIAKILRPKVVFIHFRYLVGLLMLFFGIIGKDTRLLGILVVLISFYLLWAVMKNYKYVKDIRAVVLLPVMQIISDVAVMSGATMGILSLWNSEKKQ